MLDQIIGEKSNAIAANQILNVIKGADLNGSFYIGYPILATTDETVFIDALLTSLEHGVVVFHFSDFDAPPEDLSLLRKKQDELFNTVDVKLRQYPPLLEGRTLPFEIKIVSIIPGLAEHIREEPLLATSPELLLGLLNEFAPISEEILTKINASVQRVTSIKPLRKRTYVKNEDSRGAIIKEIEKNIANLDQWQKKGAIEFPEGVQRIRGLAGSGKTIVLALKAAYLHTAHPEWDIRVTFHTRALSQQLKDLIRRFTFEHINDEPDWDKLRVIHTWGSTSDLGIYSEIALNHNIEPRNFTYGRQKYTYEHAFEGVCKELIDIIGKKNIKPIYDVMLIDEAQDLPQSFFELAYLATNEPRRIVYAYDELQNLSDYSMTPPEKLFGRDDQGTPRVPDLRNEDGAPKRDIVLPICYRNTPWALSMAHALGFGIYREQGLVQFFDNPSLLSEVGYEILDGDLNPGSLVVLKRKKDSSPHYFDKIFPEDAIDFKVFDDKRDQAEALAKSIKDDLTHGELEYRDILVIISNPLTSKKEAAILVHELNNLDISAHLAGVTSSRDRLFLDDSIAITNIYRAKGNEAPVVYIINSQYCYEGLELEKRRNILFTAITRSKAWVSLYGCGQKMDNLIDEAEKIIENQFEFRFRVPTRNELNRLNRLHRDRTPEEKREYQKIEKSLKKLLLLVKNGDLSLENMPEDIRDQLKTLFEES